MHTDRPSGNTDKNSFIHTYIHTNLCSAKNRENESEEEIIVLIMWFYEHYRVLTAMSLLHLVVFITYLVFITYVN